MADYYTHVSVEIALPSEKAAEDAVALLAEIEKHLEGQFDANTVGEERQWPDELERFKQYEFASDLVAEVEGEGIWIRDDWGGPNIDFLADYLQLVLQKFHPEGSAGFEWSTSCSKAMPGAFGGGAVFITAKEQKYVSSWQWLSEQQKEFQSMQKKAASS